jgi:hypothetical protein
MHGHMNVKLVNFVFIYISTTQVDGDKLREGERERIPRSKFYCPRMLIHGVHKARMLVYADHATVLWHLLQSDVTFTSALQGLAGATKHNRRLQVSSIPAKWARFLVRPIPVNVTASLRKYSGTPEKAKDKTYSLAFRHFTQTALPLMHRGRFGSPSHSTLPLSLTDILQIRRSSLRLS